MTKLVAYLKINFKTAAVHQLTSRKCLKFVVVTVTIIVESVVILACLVSLG